MQNTTYLPLAPMPIVIVCPMREIRTRAGGRTFATSELAITFWQQKASEFGGLPPLTAFDFPR